MRVLFISHNLAVGGGTSSLSSLYDYLKDKCDCYFFILTSNKEANVSYNDALIYPPKLLDLFYSTYHKLTGLDKLLSFILLLLKRLSAHFCNLSAVINKYFASTLCGYDIVVSYGEGPATEFTSIVKAPRKVTWIHFDYGRTPIDRDEFELYNKFDHIICVSETSKRHFDERYPLLKAKTTCIYNLFDKNRILSLAELPISDFSFNKTYTIISIGRISAIKQFDRIANIAAILKKRELDFEWIILGPASNARDLQSLLVSISSNNVSDCVLWLGNKTNPYPYLKKSNLLVSLSKSEACPMIFNEAKILNVPILSNDFESAKEFINNSSDGQICPINEFPSVIYNMLVNIIGKGKIKSELDVTEQYKKIDRIFNL